MWCTSQPSHYDIKNNDESPHIWTGYIAAAVRAAQCVDTSLGVILFKYSH